MKEQLPTNITTLLQDILQWVGENFFHNPCYGPRGSELYQEIYKTLKGEE